MSLGNKAGVSKDSVDTATCLTVLDRFAAQTGASVTSPSATARTVTDLLFGQCGFGSDRTDYQNSANSYLEQVLVRRSDIGARHLKVGALRLGGTYAEALLVTAQRCRSV